MILVRSSMISNLVYTSICILFMVHYCNSQDLLAVDEQNFVNQLFEGTKLRKCNCKTNEIFDKNQCVKSDADTTVPVIVHEDFPEPLLVNTSLFEVLDNSGLKCGSGQTLTPMQLRDFFVLPTGHLYHITTNVSFSPINYCINHVDGHQDSLEWEVHLCLEPPTIPICCNQKPTTDPRCRNPNPTIWYGYSPLKDPFIKEVHLEELRCNENQSVSQLPLSNYQDPHITAYISTVLEDPVLIIEDLKQRVFTSDEYCIRPSEAKGQYEALFCAIDPFYEHEMICKNFTCVRKCCPDGFIMNAVENTCSFLTNESDSWIPQFHNNNSDEEIPEDLKLVYGLPICSKFFVNDPKFSVDDFELLTNGSLYFPNIATVIPSTGYCLENFILAPDSKPVEKVLKCFPSEPAKMTYCLKIREVLFPSLQIISCVFLLITLIVYATIPELHSKLHGKSLISHVSALFFAYLFLSVMTLNVSAVSMSLCRTMALVIQMSFLGAFFWLNVMCFDIWWTLRSMRPVAETSETFRRRFVFYSIYAWGCPLVIVTVTCVMELLPFEEYPNLILPGFGIRDCWFQDNLSKWLYFYGFVAVLTMVDTFFFICVAIILIQAQRANNNILRTTNKQHKERVWIYLKLFVVMGITWICELIGSNEGSCEYWFFTDIINSLQGFFIFLIFICKRNIFTKLRSRGTASTRKIKRMVQGSSSYGSSSQVSQQTSLDSSRKLSSSLHYHLSKLSKENIIDDLSKKGNV